MKNSRMLFEDGKELAWAKANGHTEYAKLLTKRVASRAVGNLSVHTSAVTTYKFSLGVWSASFLAMKQAIYSMLGWEDEDDEPIESRKYMNPVETDAMLRFSKSLNHGWGGDAYVPIGRDGYRVTFFDSKRLNALGAVHPDSRPTTNPSLADYAGDMAKIFLNFLMTRLSDYINKSVYNLTQMSGVTNYHLLKDLRKL